MKNNLLSHSSNDISIKIIKQILPEFVVSDHMKVCFFT